MTDASLTGAAAMKVALVTGGAQGIGYAIARRLAGVGTAVAIFDRDPAGARMAAALPGQPLFIEGDVGSEADVRRAIAAVVARFGRLSALVNNAGISIRKPLVELALEEWERVLHTNLTGAFLCARHAAPLLAAERGAIVNIASTRAVMSEPHTEAYAASKGGLVALTHALALSLGPAVRVNCVSPGWIDVSGAKADPARRPETLSAADHAQHPAGRVGTPDDVASLVAYLLGPESGFVTGTNFTVDGGMTRKMIYV